VIKHCPALPESDHVDAMRGVVELIEGHTEEQMKYIIGKMCFQVSQISAGMKTIQGGQKRKC
jgi:hypothetical protein